MPTFYLNKLIRDKLVAEYERLGQKATYKSLSKSEHLAALRQKIIEEAREIPVSGTKDDLISEIADVQQALDDMKVLSGVSDRQVADVQRAKYDKKGGFLAGSFVETLAVRDDDKWADYYRQQPDVYPEIKDDQETIRPQ